MNHLLEVKVRYNHRKRGDSPVFVNLKKDDETTVQKIQKLQENLRAIVRYYESTPKYLKGYLIDINYNDIIANSLVLLCYPVSRLKISLSNPVSQAFF